MAYVKSLSKVLSEMAIVVFLSKKEFLLGFCGDRVYLCPIHNLGL